MNFFNKEAILFLITVTLSCVVAIFLQPMFHGNETALSTVVTIISILSGFSLLVISLLGDISIIPKSSSGVSQATRELLRKKFLGQRWLYYLYVAALLLAILTTLTVKSENYYAVIVHITLEYLFIVVSIFCLLVSFKLPSIVEEINEFKYQIAIEDLKKTKKKKAKQIKTTDNQKKSDT
jgi:hypothetical protein